MTPSPQTTERARFRADRTLRFTESVIREMSRLATEQGAVNLAQGFPDFAAPADIKQAACDAINGDINQYPITWGLKPFRDAIAEKTRRWYGLDYDPEREITVCCGATEGIIAALLALTNPGDEMIVFEPYYENYWPDSLLCQIERKTVKLQPPDWTFDPGELRRAFSPRTKAVIVNTPNNPTGKVFTREELIAIGALCQEFDALVITDEIYEHIVYDGAQHIPIATLPGMRNRSVIVNAMSKTYAVTGWRVGWVLAPPDLSDSIRKVHDFLTVAAAAPLQHAGIYALGLPPAYYAQLANEYSERRTVLMDALSQAGFQCFEPKGAYYILADGRHLGFADDFKLARHLLEHVGVASVPGSSFFSDPADGASILRFCFCKKLETLREARDRLFRL